MRSRFVCLLVLSIGVLVGQDFRAILSGRVSDTSGGAVRGAAVTATNVETGAASTSVANDTGSYTIAALPPGRYILSAEFVGFKKFVREGLTLEVQGRPQIDIVLEAGDVQSTISV